MNSCIICKILNNEIPSHKVYEDQHNIAFLDIFPYSQGHTLIVPKRHCANFSDLTDDEASRLIITGKKILNAIHDTDILSQGANLLLNENEVAGQEIMHAHLHIIPRNPGDSIKLGASSRLNQNQQQDLKKVCDKIISTIR